MGLQLALGLLAPGQAVELAGGLDAATSGIAGIGHILLGVGQILILHQVGRSVAAAETKTNR